jgi:putative membrane protein
VKIALRSAGCALAITLVAGASGAIAKPPPPGVSAADEEYLSMGIQGDRFEIQGGRVALAKSHNTLVRRLAARLVSDHEKSLAESARLARRLGIDVPKTPTPPQAWELRVARTQMSGAQFDHWYSELEALDHMQDLRDAAHEKENGFNAAIRADAAQEMPMLRQHLVMSERALHQH